MKKLSFVFFCTLILVSFFLSCKKSLNEQNAINTALTIEEAQAWISQNLNLKEGSQPKAGGARTTGDSIAEIKKLYWSLAKTKSKKTVSIVDMPYRSSAMRVEVPDTVGFSRAQQKEMAAAAIKRAVIFKKPNNQFDMYFVHIVPDYNYLKKNPARQKQNTMADLDNKFTGWIYFYDSKGTPKTVSIIENGRVKKGYNRKLGTTANNVNRYEYYCHEVCRTYTICVGGSWNPSIPIIDETDPYWDCPAAYTSYITQCSMECISIWIPDDNNNNNNPPDPSDDCNYWGTCDQNNDNGEAALQNLLNSITPASEFFSETENTSGASEREKDYVWIFAKGVRLSNLIFKSYETGVHNRINNEWQWKSLTHRYITRDGTVAGGVLDLVINSADTHCAIYNAGVSLNFTITGSLVWKGSPISSSVTKTSYKTFNISNGSGNNNE